MQTDNFKTSDGMGIHARRALAYIVLILISFLCLVWFYILFINATRAHSELTKGFTIIPSTFLAQNWKTLVTGTLP
ncbi:MAG: carbohydrate ABC transporter permease, partial [Lachnospiraceae bacterium]|nr:carbohydrate ABC transporter permease [Lachnospiraceae bacterium]